MFSSGPREPEEWPCFSGLRVLVVEDSLTNRVLMQTILREAGVEASSVGDGFAALERCMAGWFDVVFMDCHLGGGLDGLEVAELLRVWERDVGRPHQRIVALTASGLEATRGKCLAVGMTDYLSKPLRLAELFRVLNGVATSRSAALR